MFFLFGLACSPEPDLSEVAPRPAPAAPAAARVSAPGGFPAETDRAYAGDHPLEVGGVRVRVEGRVLRGPDGSVLAAGLVEAPVVSGDAMCAASEGATGEGALGCWRAVGADLEPSPLRVVGGRPDRLALAGAQVAWTASPDGLPQVFCGTLDGLAVARTNVDLPRAVPGVARGGPPEGYVPPPQRGPLRWEGTQVVWTSPRGPEAVSCP